MMPKRMNFLLGICLFLLLGQDALAKRFSSKYCEFELPPGWECALEGSEYVCQSENAERKKESIIILAAKIRGEQDNLDAYMAYLKKSKEYTLPGGKRQISEPKSTTMTNINSHQWVDALHLASEVPGFYTRYLATVKEDLGVAVTFSVGKDLYSAYQPVIDKMVASLRVFRQAKANLPSLERTSKIEDPNFADTTFNPTASMDAQFGGTKKRKGDGGGGDDMMLIIGIIAIAAIVGVILKKRKKNGKDKKKQ
jgi:LPXTG-motif cell wall-anchored protein